MILGDVAKLTPIPGLHEAARILLAVWEAVDEVETNRLQCLRLTERCAMAIYSVRAEIADAERDMQSQQGQNGDVGVVGLAEEMEGPVRKLNECIEMVYNFLLKLNRRPFLKRFLRSDEIQEEILACDKALGDAMQMFSISIQIRILKEFKRFARDTRLDPVHHAQGPTPPPVYASPLPPAQNPPLSPLQSVQSQTNDTDPPSDAPISPLTELQDLHVVENASDREQDRALFRSTLQRAISARRDAEVLQVLEVRPGEVPEALKALRRAEEALRREREANERKGGDLIDEGLERVFMETGIEAMTRLSSVAVQKAEDQDVDVPWDLPPWTITRYEVDRLTMIGSGSFSKVYLGSWSGRRVAIKVLSLHTPAPLFRKAVEIWRKLKHENVLGMWGASSAQGERPWFIVSEYCSGGSLVGWLRERKGRGDVDLLRCMHYISKGMVYLHDQNVLHEDLKASNVLVDDNGRCVISDFGQSEMKWEASRGGGKPITNGTLRWQAPELLNGPMRLSTATDVYAFSICCIEILGMGDLPYGHRDDTLVAFLVNYQNKRPEIPSTPITSLVEPLIQECWVRDPEQRPTFTHIAATLKRLRKHQGGVEESPIPVQAEVLLTAWSDPPHHSPSMHPLELPETSPSTLQEGQMPEGGIAIYTPTRKLSLAESDSMSSASSHHTSSPEAEHSALEEVRRRHRSPHVALGYKPSLPMDEQLTERKNELRFRSLAQSSHDFHHSLTLPLWSPSHVELGAVGYLSAPKGEFITLFNAMKPHKTTGSKVTNIPSLAGYLEGPIRVGKKPDSLRTMTQRGLELISGLLTFPLIDRDGSYSERISRRHPFPLRAGHKAAFIYAESTMYRFIEDLAAPKDWFKANVNTIVKEYAPYHPIQKEDVILVFGTLSAPEYALFVSHSHPNGQAHFNVFSDRQSGRPWGTFTTDTEYPSDEGGPSYIEEIPRKAVFASKVSPMRPNAGSNDKDWDTLVLARLRFPTDATEPTSQ
ncbi:kinase-like domain-containing protein [Suillus tomentosus]|nr:kinase-like domain-containing protein [Suillus tomentosus]